MVHYINFKTLNNQEIALVFDMEKAASSQRPCHKVSRRKVKQIAPLGIWVMLVLPVSIYLLADGVRFLNNGMVFLCDIYQHK